MPEQAMQWCTHVFDHGRKEEGKWEDSFALLYL